MQSSDFEPDLSKKWFRRPTVFVAVAWMLLCAVGKIAVTKLAVPVDSLFRLFGVSLSREALTMGLDLCYKLGVLALPVVVYAARHEGVTLSMRIRAPSAMTMVYAVIIGGALAPLSRTLTVMWTLVLETAGGHPVYAVRAPDGMMDFAVRLVIDALLAGVCEELMMRGGLIGAWERRGTERALAVTTLLSAALAGSITEMPSNIVLGLTFGLIAVMGNSLWPAITAHVTYSALMIVTDFHYGSYELTSLRATIVENGHLTEYLLSLGGALGLWALLIVVYRSLCRQGGRWTGMKKIDYPEEMDAGEVLILFIAFMTVALLVGENFVSILALNQGR